MSAPIFASAMYADTPEDMRAAVLRRFDDKLTELRTFRTNSKSFMNKRIYSRAISEVYIIRQEFAKCVIHPLRMRPAHSDHVQEHDPRQRDLDL